MGKVWVIADTHFGHKNILKYCNRPFKDTHEMDELMIERWNEVVDYNQDTVFHLGDFAMGLKFLDVKLILERLNGRKILIMGNHDYNTKPRFELKDRNYWLRAGFEQVIEYPIVYEKFFILSHYPMFMNEHMPYVNIHGHIHQNLMAGNQFVNVGVEHTEYRPVLLQDILDKYKRQIENEEQ